MPEAVRVQLSFYIEESLEFGWYNETIFVKNVSIIQTKSRGIKKHANMIDSIPFEVEALGCSCLKLFFNLNCSYSVFNNF